MRRYMQKVGKLDSQYQGRAPPIAAIVTYLIVRWRWLVVVYRSEAFPHLLIVLPSENTQSHVVAMIQWERVQTPRRGICL